MEYSLDSARTRQWFLLVCAAVSLVLIFQGTELWVANRRLDSRNLESMKRGAELIPGDADAWDRLGRFRQWSFTDPDPSAAIEDFQRAVEVDPLSANYWTDLATAYETAGEIGKAQAAYTRASADYPVSAQVAWDYGNFLLRQQEFSAAYKEVQRAVRTDANLIPLAISRVWRASGDVNILFDRILPKDVDAYFQALDFFQGIRQTEPGLIAWQRVLSLGKTFTLKRTFPFLEELIREDRSADAQRVWQQAIQASGAPQEAGQGASLVWNGNFAQDFANGGLGWRWDPPTGAAFGFEPAPLSLPGRSFRLDFGGGTNPGLQSPSQDVPVEPNRTYHFRAYVRTEGLTTESGIRFGLWDPNHPGQVNVLTDNLAGTNAWQPVDTDVKTGADTHFLLIYMDRSPSRLFENRLSGTVWTAGISLTPSESAKGESAR